MTSLETPSPDRDEYCDGSKAGADLGNAERRGNRNCPSSERRALDVTEQQEARQRTLGLVLLCVGKRSGQVRRRDNEALYITADHAVRRGDNEAGGMDVGIEQGVVAVRKSHDVGNP